MNLLFLVEGEQTEPNIYFRLKQRFHQLAKAYFIGTGNF
jgi:hypothetical protein